MENSNRNELKLRDVLKILKRYIWFIIFTIFISFLISSIYLFFEPSIYSTTASIEVITYDKSNQATNDLLQNTFYANKEVDKEMEKLTTYEVNRKVIDNMNLNTQIFIKDGYRKHEIYYKDAPIVIDYIKYFDDKILDRFIKIIPHKNGYSLEVENLLQEKINYTLFNKKMLTLTNKIFPYDKNITTKYFQISIKKKKELKGEIYFKINGDSYDIYEKLIKNRLTVAQTNPNAPILDISYEDNIPQRARDYANKLVKVFENEGRREKSKRNNQLGEFIKTELIKNSKELKKAEKALENYRIGNKAIKISTQSDIIIKELNNLEVAIADYSFREMIVEDILNIIKNNDSFNSIGPLLSALGDRINLVYLKSLEKLELEEEALSSEYTEEYPKYISVHQQIDTLKKKIYSNIQSLKSSILYKKRNLQKLKKKKELLLKRLPIDQTNIVNLNRKYNLLLKMNNYLSEKEKENNTIKAAIVSDYNIVEHAHLPKYPVKPKKSLIQILSLILGALVGVVLSLLHYGLSDKVTDIDDIEKHTKLEVSAIIPPFTKKYKKRNIVVFKYPQSILSESFRKLRTDLLFISDSNKSNVFLVTSMFPKEGKSTILSNLSAVFQLAKYKTIVIDLDLRNPSLHKYFDIDYGSGISNYLEGRADISDIVFPTAYNGLDIIPVGSIPTNPSELILSNRIKIMLKKLKENYDYIIIDSTSIGTATDTLTLMKYSDVNLVVLRKDYSKKSSISKLENMISKYNLKNIRLVMNVSRENEKY